MWWIWILYVICIVIVVYASSKLAGIVDELNKKTKLSGAFLGAVLLAGVTSLPELVTSITGAIQGEANMTLGNILGSNIFDIAIIGVLMIVFSRHIAHKHLSKANVLFVAFTLAISVLVLLCMIFGVEIVIPGININLLTPIIIVLYIVALISTREVEPKVRDKDKTDVPNKFAKYSVKSSAISPDTNGTRPLYSSSTISFFFIIFKNPVFPTAPPTSIFPFSFSGNSTKGFSIYAFIFDDQMRFIFALYVE